MQVREFARGENVAIVVTIKENNLVVDPDDFDYFRLDIGTGAPAAIVLSKQTDLPGEGAYVGTTVRFYLLSADTLALTGDTYRGEVWGLRAGEAKFVRWPDCCVTLKVCSPMGLPPT